MPNLLNCNKTWWPTIFLNVHELKVRRKKPCQLARCSIRLQRKNIILKVNQNLDKEQHDATLFNNKTLLYYYVFQSTSHHVSVQHCLRLSVILGPSKPLEHQHVALSHFGNGTPLSYKDWLNKYSSVNISHIYHLSSCFLHMYNILSRGFIHCRF